MYSATGSALAAAAEDTAIPRSQQASVTCPRTEPAECTTALRAGAAASTSASSGGQPQPVTSTSTSASTSFARTDVRSSSTGSGARSQTSVSAAMDRGVNTAAAAWGDMANATRGLLT